MPRPSSASRLERPTPRSSCLERPVARTRDRRDHRRRARPPRSAHRTPTLRERAYGEAEGIERPRSSSRAGATGTAPRSPARSRGRTCASAALRAPAPRSCATPGATTAPAAASVIVVTHGALIRELHPACDRRRAAADGRAARERFRPHHAVRARAASAAVVRAQRRLGSAAWQPRNGRRVHRGVPARGRRAAAAASARSSSPRSRASGRSPRRRSDTASPRSCSAVAMRCTSPAGRSTSASTPCRLWTSRSRAEIAPFRAEKDSVVFPHTSPSRTSSSRVSPPAIVSADRAAAQSDGD